MKKKLAMFISGGPDSGFKKSERDWINYMKSYEDEFDVYVDQKDNYTIDVIYEIRRKMDEGYKVVTMGKSINYYISNLSGLNIVDPKKPKLAPIFDRLYINRQPVKFSVEDEFDIEVFAMYHPLYHISARDQMFMGSNLQAMNNFIGAEPRENKKVVNTAYSYSELYDFIMARYNNKVQIEMSYDVESNFEFVYSDTLDLVGFSLSFDGVEGVYALMESFDYSMTDEDKEKCRGMLKWLLSRPNVKVVVHNSMYELPATVNYAGFEIPYERLEDTLVWSKIFNSGRIGGNDLKSQAVYRLRYSDWSVDLDVFRSALLDTYKQLLKLKKKKNSNIVSYDSLMAHPAFFELDSIATMRMIIDKYYTDSSELIHKYLSKMVELSINPRDSDLKSYGYLPSRLISKYGCIDSIATRELLDHYRNLADSLSEKYRIKMKEGYEIWMESQYVAYKLELNSSAYNIEQVIEDEKGIQEVKANSLRKVLTSYRSEIAEFIKTKLKSKALIEYSMSDEYRELIESSPKFIGYTGSGMVKYEVSREPVKVEKKTNGRFVKDELTGKRKKVYDIELVDDFKVVSKNINPKKIDDIISAVGASRNRPNDFVNKYVRDWVNDIDSKSIEELESVLNPDKDEAKGLLITTMYNEMIGAAKLVVDMNAHMKTESYKIEVANNVFNTGELELFELASTYDMNSTPQVKEEFFIQFTQKLSVIRLGSKLSTMLVHAADWRMETVDEASMTDLFSYYTVAGVDVDRDRDKDTEFRILFHIRVYKKANKLLTTYIRGKKLGVSQSYVVDKSKYENGDIFVPRKRSYHLGDQISEDEMVLYQGTWKPNSVMTGRWASPIHTLPAGSDPKRHLVTRFRGGCIAAPDLSQAELRTVARAANDTTLLDAYVSGIDVHLTTARSIFRRNEVTETERRYAKMGCAVGSTKIKLMDGTSPRIDSLYERWINGDRDIHVPSYSKDKGLVVGKVVDVQLTKYVDKICKVTFDDGNSVEMTPDHLLLLKGQEDEYVEMKDSLGREIEPLYYRYPSNGAYHGYEQWRDTYCRKKMKDGTYGDFTGKWVMTHLIAASEYNMLGNGGQVNHINNLKFDNERYNLEYIDKSTHGSKTRRAQTHPFCIGSQFLRVSEYMKSRGIEVNEINYDKCRIDVYPTDYVHGTSSAKYSTVVNYYSGVENIPSRREEREYDYFNARKGQSYDNSNSKKVVSVEIIDLIEKVPVYDLSVDKYHNYVVDFEDGSGIYVHNTFQILYGGTPESFASQYLNGDVELARNIFDGFFNAYPKIKEWMHDRHKEIIENGLVTTMTQRLIYLGYEGPGVDINKILRQSGNAPKIEARI